MLQHALSLCRAGVDLRIIVQKCNGGWEDFDPPIASELKDRVYVLPETTWAQWPHRFKSRVLSADVASFLLLLLFSVRAGSWDLVKHLPTWTKVPTLGRFDAVLAHFGPVGVLALILRKAGIIEGPIATIFHGFDMSRAATISRYKRGYQYLFQLTERLLPISQLWRKTLIQWGAPEDLTKVLHMGVDLPDTPPDFSRRMSRPLQVLTVGRLTHKKAHADTIKAVGRCQSPVNLKVIGSGELDRELKILARNNPKNEVLFLGAQPHSMVQKAISKSDVFILPSVTAENGEKEGIPVALMEAMARGAIVISTKHSGISELVVNGETGFLVEENDPDAIARLIDEIVHCKYDLPAIRRRAYRHIQAEFCNEELNAHLLNHLRELSGVKP